MNRLGRLGELVQQGSLCVLLFLLPFSNAAVEINFGLLLLGWVMARLDPRTRKNTLWLHPPLRPLAVSMWVFIAVCAASTLVSNYPVQSLSGVINKWLEYLLFTWILVDLGGTPAIARRSAIVIACSSVLVAIEALTQEFFKKGLVLHHEIAIYGRMTGPYRNPTDLATYLMVVLPVILCLAVRCRQTLVRRGLYLLVAILVSCFARTETRGAWLGIGAAILAMVLVSTDWQIKRFGAIMLGGALAVMLIIFAAGRLKNTFSATEIGQVDRRDMWTAAAHMIKDRPWLGHGINTFMANYLRYWVGGERQPRYAHNCYLQMAAETGVVGLMAFLWLLYSLHIQLAAGLRALSSHQELLLLGLWVGLVAFVVQSSVDTNFYSLRQSALFWILAGMAVGFNEYILSLSSAVDR